MNPNDDASSSFTRIPNSVLGWLLGPEHDLTFRQVRVLFTVFRFTYGFSRRSAPLSSRYVAEYTGIDQSDCSKALKSLVDAGLLTVHLERKIGFYTLCPRKYKNKKIHKISYADEGDSPSRGRITLEIEGDSPSKIRKKKGADDDHCFPDLAERRIQPAFDSDCREFTDEERELFGHPLPDVEPEPPSSDDDPFKDVL